MRTILNLFGKSPFAPLASHMKTVSACVHLIKDLFISLEKKKYSKIQEITDRIHETEHKADLAKNNIRNHLPKTLFLPIDRGHLLEILTLQDSLADKAEDIAVLVTLKELDFLDELKENFYLFLDKNIETFNGAKNIIKEFHELLESSFGGLEAEKVRSMVDEVAFKENEVDILQRALMKQLIQLEDKMTYTTFFLWQSIIKETANISNLSENLAYRVRRTLDIK